MQQEVNITGKIVGAMPPLLNIKVGDSYPFPTLSYPSVRDVSQDESCLSSSFIYNCSHQLLFLNVKESCDSNTLVPRSQCVKKWSGGSWTGHAACYRHCRAYRVGSVPVAVCSEMWSSETFKVYWPLNCSWSEWVLGSS